MSDTASSTCPYVGRFAPSPTGRIHAGNIAAYLVTWTLAKRNGGRIVLRIEDIDTQRSKRTYSDAIMRDLDALGLHWDEGPVFQSTRQDAYLQAYQMLEDDGVLYPCFCSRADINALSAPHQGEMAIYPGTCRLLTASERREREDSLRETGRRPSVRFRAPRDVCTFEDLFQGACSYNMAQDCGDFVIRRSDGAFAYQLAVVVDDAAQGVTSVVRGADLLRCSPWQMCLQKVLGLPPVEYGHIPLLVAKGGRRISKRDADASLDDLTKTYKTSEGVIGHISFVLGIMDEDRPTSAEDLVTAANLDALKGKMAVEWR